MITLVSASNRHGNLTQLFTEWVFNYLQNAKGVDVQVLDLNLLDPQNLGKDMYQRKEQVPEISQLRQRYFLPVHKFWFFIPEYNGSFPGILKLLMDVLSVQLLKETFSGKKACITGIASGRSGNIRGMDHLSDILHHLDITVLPNKLPISSIHKLLDEEKKLVDKETISCLKTQADQFLNF